MSLVPNPTQYPFPMNIKGGTVRTTHEIPYLKLTNERDEYGEAIPRLDVLVYGLAGIQPSLAPPTGCMVMIYHICVGGAPYARESLAVMSDTIMSLSVGLPSVLNDGVGSSPATRLENYSRLVLDHYAEVGVNTSCVGKALHPEVANCDVMGYGSPNGKQPLTLRKDGDYAREGSKEGVLSCTALDVNRLTPSSVYVLGSTPSTRFQQKEVLVV